MIADLEKRMLQLLARDQWSVMGECCPGGQSPIRVLRSKFSVPGAPRLLVTAGVHGDEPAGTLAILDFMEKNLTIPEVSWTILPYLNPYGLVHGTRENHQNIDLNRDFRSCRTEEVVFYQNIIPAHGPYDLLVALHEDWEFIGSYVYEINTGQRESLVTDILSVMEACTGLVDAPLIDDHTPSAPGLIVHQPEADEPENWPEAIYMVKQQPLLCYTIETPSQIPLAERICCHQEVLSMLAARLANPSKNRVKSSPEGS